jgi:hypothetical protein
MVIVSCTLSETDYLEDISVDGKITLKWILEKQVEKMWTGFIWLRKG